MAGRGKAATLPAWMSQTAPASSVSDSLQPSSVENVPAVVSEELNTQQALPSQIVQTAQQPIQSSLPNMGWNPQQLPTLQQPMPFMQLPPQYHNSSSMSMLGMGMPSMYPPPYGGVSGAGGVSLPSMGMLPPAMNSGMFTAPPMASTTIAPTAVAPFNRPIAPQPAIDPVNDVSAWSEHEQAGRKYWFNRVTAQSTYDKPFCLKTPEERSIPPCPWKEYATAEGKIYYSNGTESIWTMPEEFRVWKEKVELAAQKKSTASTTATATNSNDKTSSSKHGLDQQRGEDADMEKKKAKIGNKSQQQEQEPIYATKEEARDAFLSLLQEKNISSNMKAKEVQDACQDDKRWNALKGGEKKQEIAEYQTKKLKLEKEQLKLKSKKNRDAFLLMLAENVEIDSRSRWRDAMLLLQNDVRYKNVEDTREREDLFNEFVAELEKRDREDRNRRRDGAGLKFKALFDQCVAAGTVTRKSVWGDHRAYFIEQATKDPELRLLEDVEVRQHFQTLIDQLNRTYQQQRKERRLDAQATLTRHLESFRHYLEKIAVEGCVHSDTKWKEFSNSNSYLNFPQHQEMEQLLQESMDKSSDLFGLMGDPRDVFGKVQKLLLEAHRCDRDLLRDTVREFQLYPEIEGNFHVFKQAILKIAGMKETSVDGVCSFTMLEDGEEVDDCDHPFDVTQNPSHYGVRSIPNYLRLMLVRRPRACQVIFEIMHNDAIMEKENEAKKLKRKEERFLDLLAEHFYRSDHVGLSWDDAKRKIDHTYEYEDLHRDDRKRLFQEHMNELSRRLESKTKAMQQQQQQQQQQGALPEPRSEEQPLARSDKDLSSKDHTKSEAIIDGNVSDSSSTTSSHASNRSKDRKKAKKSKSDKKEKKHKSDSDKSSKHKRKA